MRCSLSYLPHPLLQVWYRAGVLVCTNTNGGPHDDHSTHGMRRRIPTIGVAGFEVP